LLQAQKHEYVMVLSLNWAVPIPYHSLRHHPPNHYHSTN